MPTSQPYVSIGLPVYNGAEFLAAALDSLLAQSFEDFELIVSDNHSTDETEAVCRTYATRDPRVRYYRQAENQGAIRNFNLVFELSRGTFFKWASHDDVCSPIFLERCLDVLRADTSILWCHSRSRHIDAGGRPFGEPDKGDVSYAYPQRRWSTHRDTRESARPHERFRAVMLGHGGCLDSYGLIRTEVIRKTPLYLPCYGAEKVFIAELALRGRFREVAETLFFPRVHPKAAGSLKSAAAQREYMSPESARGIDFTRLSLLRGYLSAIRRVDLEAAERVRCLLVVLQYLFQIEKWGRVLTSTVTGAGLVHERDYEQGDQYQRETPTEHDSDRPSRLDAVGADRASQAAIEDRRSR